MSHPAIIYDWSTWCDLGDKYGFNPHEEWEWSVGEGGGNSSEYEYAGKVPEDED